MSVAQMFRHILLHSDFYFITVLRKVLLFFSCLSLALIPSFIVISVTRSQERRETLS